MRLDAATSARVVARYYARKSRSKIRRMVSTLEWSSAWTGRGEDGSMCELQEVDGQRQGRWECIQAPSSSSICQPDLSEKEYSLGSTDPIIFLA